MKKPELKSMTVRMPEATLKRLDASARREYRSRAAEVLARIDESFAREAKAAQPQAQPVNP